MANKEKGLMTKTKKELVEIILRKDDEEIRLRNSYEVAKENAKKSEDDVKHLTDSLNKANANVQQHRIAMDELTSDKVAAEEAAKKFKKERNTARNWNWVLAIAVVIIAALCIIF